MFGDANRPPGSSRIPVKLHRRVVLVLTEDALLAEEILARKKLAQDVVGRLTDRVLLVRPGRVDAVIAELQKMGHTPRVGGERRPAPEPEIAPDAETDAEAETDPATATDTDVAEPA